MDSEANEIQQRSDFERQKILDGLFGPNAYLGFPLTAQIPQNFTLGAGKISWLGHLIDFPGKTFSRSAGSTEVWVEVVRFVRTDADEPVLLSHPDPGDSRQVAEREEWIYNLSTSDTASNPLPTGSTSRSTARLGVLPAGTNPTFQFDFVLLPKPGDAATLNDHVGQGGESKHPAATPSVSGFMSAGDKTKLDNHVGKGGLEQHPAATHAASGFMSSSDKEKLDSVRSNPALDHFLALQSLFNVWMIPTNMSYSRSKEPNINFSELWNNGNGGTWVSRKNALSGSLQESRYSNLKPGGASSYVNIFFFTTIRVVTAPGAPNLTSAFRVPVIRCGDALRIYHHNSHVSRIVSDSGPLNLPPSPTQAFWSSATVEGSGSTVLTEFETNRNFLLNLQSGLSYTLSFVLYDGEDDDEFWMYLRSWINQPPISGDPSARIVMDPDYPYYMNSLNGTF